jgi:hypothetical protein
MRMDEFYTMEMEGGPESGRPERPFPLRPGTWFLHGLAQDFPVSDETDLIFADNIITGDDAFKIFGADKVRAIGG